MGDPPETASNFAVAAELELRLSATAGNRFGAFEAARNAASLFAPVDALSVILTDPQSGKLITAYASEDAGVTVPPSAPGPMLPAQQVWRSGIRLVANHALRGAPIPPGAAAAAHLPMRAVRDAGEPEPIGVLSVCSLTAGAYTEDRLDALQWLADRLAGHLARELDWEDGRRKLAEAEDSLHRRWDEMLTVTGEAIQSVEEIRALVDGMAASPPPDTASLGDALALLQLRCKSAATRISELPIRFSQSGRTGAATESARDRLARLSVREREILSLIGSGSTYSEMARELFVSVSTVKFHCRNVLRKLGLATKAQAETLVREWSAD